MNEVPVEVEEYDPSQTLPTFVVTLTGLDPKLYPEDNMELNENLDIESNQSNSTIFNAVFCFILFFSSLIIADDQQEFFSDYEENKIKTKLPEQCKYYPNCLAGDQCLYQHPTIPCKYELVIKMYSICT